MLKEISKPQKAVIFYVRDTGMAFHHFYSIKHDCPCCHISRYKTFWMPKGVKTHLLPGQQNVKYWNAVDTLIHCVCDFSVPDLNKMHMSKVWLSYNKLLWLFLFLCLTLKSAWTYRITETFRLEKTLKALSPTLNLMLASPPSSRVTKHHIHMCAYKHT